MNPRQRRAVLLLALAGAGLIGVFALVANYVSEIESEVGDKVVVLELTRPVQANQAVPDNAVRTRTIPSRWKPEAAFTAREQLTGYVAASDLQPRAILQEGMLAAPPEINEGEREVAILVDASDRRRRQDPAGRRRRRDRLLRGRGRRPDQRREGRSARARS